MTNERKQDFGKKKDSKDVQHSENKMIDANHHHVLIDSMDTIVDICCICQDVVNMTKQGSLSTCTHCFHYDCIITWSRVTNLCPLCKLKFNAVTQVNADGTEVHRQVIQDTQQVYGPEPLDHDLAAQLQLSSQARCEFCGSGEDEHVLLLCEAMGCEVANHTYCIGLSEVPNTSWYCSNHATSQQRASDVIERPALTATTRRRTRRLTTLMSNVLRGRGRSTAAISRRQETSGFVAVEEEEDRRPIRGITATYALRMSRELMQVQQRADAMFARGDLTQSLLYERRENSALSSTSRHGTRSSVAATLGSSTMDRMWDDNSRSRQELAAAAIARHDPGIVGESGSSTRPSQRANRVSNTFAPEYCALAKLMQDAVSSDNYASSVALMIPKTAKLRLVSRVKTFFGRLNPKEKTAAVELGCLSVLHQWIHRQDEGDVVSSPNTQVLDVVLTILETLPLREQDLMEERIQTTLNTLSELSDISIETRQRIIVLNEKWCELNPPVPCEPARPQARQHVSSSPVNATQDLPVITAFTSPMRPLRLNGKRKRDAWSDAVVKYVKAKLYPLYKEKNGTGNLTRERFKSIVKEVADLFSQETLSMQSVVLLPSGELSNLAKSRVKKLIDRVYKESAGCSAFAIQSTAPTSLLMRAGVAASTYSAVPASKRQRRP